eukprot:13438395-Alexandrium_andersonii.AAC.1
MIDSANVAKGFRAICRGVGGPSWRPWALGPNGDLWAAVAKLMAERGEGAQEVIKVKGHARDEHLVAGVSTPAQKRGNDKADLHAGRAVDRERESMAAYREW